MVNTIQYYTFESITVPCKDGKGGAILKSYFFIYLMISVLFIVAGETSAQDVAPVLYDVALTPDDMIENFTLVNENEAPLFIDIYGNYKTVLSQTWVNTNIDPYQWIKIKYAYFDTFIQAIIFTNEFNRNLTAPVFWGSLTERIMGDCSCIDMIGASDLFIEIVRNNFFVLVTVLGDTTLNQKVLMDLVNNTLLVNFDKYTSNAVLQDLETKRQTQLPADTFDQLVSAKLVPYTKHDPEDSKWVINESDYVLGWRQQWTNESGKMIGIDIAKFASQSDADSALELRRIMSRYMSHIIDDPLDPKIPSETWLNQYFIGFPSVLFSYKNYAVHVYSNNPYLRGDSTGTVDTLLFDMDRDVAENIDAFETTGIEESGPEVKSPRDHLLSANWPNPFNPGTSISYTLHEPGEIELAIYDLRGARVATLAHGRQPAGEYTVSWDGRYESGVPAPSGTYFYRLTVTGPSGTITDRKKMTLVR